MVPEPPTHGRMLWFGTAKPRLSGQASDTSLDRTVQCRSTALHESTTRPLAPLQGAGHLVAPSPAVSLRSTPGYGLSSLRDALALDKARTRDIRARRLSTSTIFAWLTSDRTNSAGRRLISKCLKRNTRYRT